MLSSVYNCSMKIFICSITLLVSLVSFAQNESDKSVDDLFSEMDAQASEGVKTSAEELALVKERGLELDEQIATGKANIAKLDEDIAAENAKQEKLDEDIAVENKALASELEKGEELDAEGEKIKQEKEALANSLLNAVTPR